MMCLHSAVSTLCFPNSSFPPSCAMFSCYLIPCEQFFAYTDSIHLTPVIEMKTSRDLPLPSATQDLAIERKDVNNSLGFQSN